MSIVPTFSRLRHRMASPVELYGHKAADVIERVDVSGDGGCIKHVLRRGAGPKAIPGRTVNAHYDGKLTNGVQFDASRKRGKEFSFPLGAGRVIKGWDVGFASMSVGEKAVLELKPSYGYGAEGAGGVIPGNATLFFEVELMSIA